MKESQLQKAIKDYLILNGWMVYRVNTVGIRGRKAPDIGMSDLICLKDGIVMFAEIKLPAGKPSNEQLLFATNVSLHGGHYRILRSLKDAEDMNKFVEMSNY